MRLRFGTSGVRGLADEMTDSECARFAQAFIRYLRSRAPVSACALAGDFRSSTPRILEAVAWGLHQEGLAVHFWGRIATPGLALSALRMGIAGIMVTGSHIPDDRNGIKFYFPWGEVLKPDEKGILSAYRELGQDEPVRQVGGSRSSGPSARLPLPKTDPIAEAAYRERYLRFFPSGVLRGLRLVVYQHSSVSRDLLVQILENLGAQVFPEGRSEQFVAVDTEAVENLVELAGRVHRNQADALVSTDGDGDRPLLIDESGIQVRGDNLGILAARYLDAGSVSVPVSATSAVEKTGWFARVRRTRIGSPWVIESMNRELAAGEESVVGWEANGGFLTASPLSGLHGRTVLDPLPTRDALLPLLAVLALSRKEQVPVSRLLRSLPPVFTCSGILRRFPLESGEAIIRRFASGGLAESRRVFAHAFGHPAGLDLTDGARITFADGTVVHLRPSGNAPEFRCYTEAATQPAADDANLRALGIVQELAAGRE